jgi:HSP20 family protein
MTFRDEVDRLLSTLTAEGGARRGGVTPDPRRLPALNIWEDERTIFIEAELPGYADDELNIDLLGNELRISGERKRPAEPDDVIVHRRERETAPFTRTIPLPMGVDPAEVNAECRHGVLMITCAKAKKAVPRRIEVTARS